MKMECALHRPSTYMTCSRRPTSQTARKSTPMSTSVKYRLNPDIEEGGAELEDKTLYRSVVGALQYAT